MDGKVTIATLALAGTAALALAGCSAGSGGRPAADGSPGTASSVGAATSPATASGGSAVTEKKTGSTADVITFPPGGAASVVAWYHGRGGTEFTSLTKVLDNATRAETKGGVTAFAQTCGQIRSAARAAQAAPPMPLAGLAKVYDSALAQYVKAATQCQQALAAGDSKSLKSAVGAVEANSVTLNRAAAVLIAALSDR